VLSQFAKTAKGSSLEGDEDDDAFAALAVVDDEKVWEDVEDTEEAAVADDDSEATNPLDPSVQDSDLAVIQEITRDAGYDERTPVLTHKDINLGSFAIFKVCPILFFVYHLMSV
jgi:hypothetical protein